jgi:HNH endonuclease
MPHKSTTEALFMAKVFQDPETGCWLWQGSLKANGYAQMTVDGRNGLLGHRWAYEHFIGPIAKRLVLDHLCRIRRCVNPAHLEAITQAENMQRWKDNPAAPHEGTTWEDLRRSRRAVLRAHTDDTIVRYFRVTEVEIGGCWLWWGRRSEDGYALVGNSGRRVHRWAYERFIGPIPEGMQLDHLCRIRHCVNPWHMEPVTSRENTLRGETITGRNARKTHCPAGHPLEGENLYLYRGKRSCKECRREHVRSQQRKHRQELMHEPMLFSFP